MSHNCLTEAERSVSQFFILETDFTRCGFDGSSIIFTDEIV